MVKLSSLRTDRYLKYKLNQNQSKFTNYRKPFSISDTGHCQNIWKPKSHQVIACKNRRLHLIQFFSVGVFPDAGRQSDQSISKLVWPFDPSDLTWICWPDPNFFANENPFKLAFTRQPNPTCCSFNETYTKHLDQDHFVQDVQNKHRYV